MEYAAMLSAPDLVSGLRDLLADPDQAVVKRTIRVFANVYRHALQLLSSGDLDEVTFNGAWPAVRSVAEELINMLASAENEGLIIHIVRFLEAALVAHLLADVNRYPELAAQSPKMVAKGIAALKGLVTTPYVGGSAFIVAVRALITVACYKPDLWAPVTNLIEKQIASPPPTLFDHNVRSLHKILQRNLFRLLRRADSPALRRQLIDMMVTVGVPRRMLSQWAPPQESRKRPSQVAQSEDAITGRSTPPTKRPKYEGDSVDERPPTPPRDPRDPHVPRDPREVHVETRDPRAMAEPRDPRTAQRADPRLSPPLDPRTSVSQDPPSKPNTPPASGRSTPEDKKVIKQKKVKEVNSNFEFLKSLITSTKKKPELSTERFSEKERALYERLDHPHVVELVLSCLDSVPDSPPEDLLAKLGHGSGDVDGIREHLTRLLAPHIHTDFINSLTPVEEDNAASVSNPPSRPSSTSSASTAFSNRVTPPLPHQREPSPPSPPSSNRSTPTDPSQMCNSDVDLRQLLNRGFQNTGDVDMRTGDLQRPARDPRSAAADHKHAADQKTSQADPRASRTNRPKLNNNVGETRTTVINTSTRLDPRIAMTDPRRTISDPSDLRINNMDPRITQSFTDARDPRLGNCPDLREQMMVNNQRDFMGMGNGLPGARNNMMHNNFNNFDNRFGNGGGMNGQDPRMMNGPMGMGMGNGPMDHTAGGMGNVNPQDQGFMRGGNNMYGGAGSRGVGGPWQGNMQQNRMSMMMPMMNGGPGMFPQAPPMHL